MRYNNNLKDFAGRGPQPVTPDDLTDSEKRGSARRRSMKSATAILPNGGVIDCVVRDVSDTGARLQVGNTVSLPESFELRIPSAAPVRVTIICRKARVIGVRFDNQ